MGPLVGIIGSHETAKGVVSKTPVHKMFGSQAGDLPVIGIDQRQAKTADRAAHIHHRHTESTDEFSHLRRFHPGDDAVSLPVPKPDGNGVGPLPFLALHGPFVVLAHELANAQEQSPAISPRRLDDQRHASAALWKEAMPAKSHAKNGRTARLETTKNLNRSRTWRVNFFISIRCIDQTITRDLPNFISGCTTVANTQCKS